MGHVKNFLRDESGVAEAASSALMVAMASGLSGIWDGGLTGIWNSVINNPSVSILGVFVLSFLLWVVVKA